jgi:hypothetical protein
VRGVILVSLENASFLMVYTINWFKKCSILITVLTLSNCHKRGGGAYHGTVVYFVIFRCRFFPSVPRPLSWNIYAKKQFRHINRAGYNNVCELID